MSKIFFAAISPHPPLLLPSVGSNEDKLRVEKTIESLRVLGKELENTKPDLIIISSPHEDWGFNVPLFFLAEDFKGEIKKYLIGPELPNYYFEQGKEIYQKLKIDNCCVGTVGKLKIALIASGDLSHCLKEDGPYGFHSDGPKFDKTLIECLKNKDIEGILNLDTKYPEAGECGLRSFCFLLGFLEEYSKNSKQTWQTEILSYEGPFGVGYLTAKFNLK